MATQTLTGLIPTIYTAFDTVSREMTGFIRAVARDNTAARAAQDEVVRSPVVPALAAEDLGVGATAADIPATTTGYVDMTISKLRSVPFGLTGEDTLRLTNGGTLGVISRDRITQAIRTLVNEIEADVGALHTKASRAYGTATGTPFGTAANLSDLAACRRILEDNGAPQSDLHIVNCASNIERIRGVQSSLFKVNEAGTDELLRQGSMGRLQGFDVHQSAGVKLGVAVGSFSSGTLTSAVRVVGATSLVTTADYSAGLGAGDIITLAHESGAHKYVVQSCSASAITIQEPGLKTATAATGTVAITLIAATNRSMFFHRGAIQLATRAPAMPEGGDSADDVMVVTDPVTGMAFEFAVYRQKRQVRYEVNLAWGVAMVQPRHCGLLIGA